MFFQGVFSVLQLRHCKKYGITRKRNIFWLKSYWMDKMQYRWCHKYGMTLTFMTSSHNDVAWEFERLSSICRVLYFILKPLRLQIIWDVYELAEPLLHPLIYFWVGDCSRKQNLIYSKTTNEEFRNFCSHSKWEKIPIL